MSRGESVVFAAGALAVLVTLLTLMWLGWRRRTARSAAVLPDLPAVPARLGDAVTEPAEVLYLGTTTAGAWLDRVTAHTLGERTAAVIHVHPAGVLVARGRRPDLFIAAADLIAAERVTAFAGKVVGGHGITQITWRAASGTDLATGLRLRHRADQDRALTALGAVARAEAQEDHG